VSKRAFYGIALLVAATDQATKLFVSAHVPMGGAISLFRDTVRIEPTRNTGGAFGILQSYGSVIGFLTVVAIILIFAAYRCKLDLPGNAWTGLALVMGGAVGNLVDRVRLGYVFDFVNLKFWPVFNVADVAITVGFIVLLCVLIVRERRQRAEG